MSGAIPENLAQFQAFLVENDSHELKTPSKKALDSLLP